MLHRFVIRDPEALVTFHTPAVGPTWTVPGRLCLEQTPGETLGWELVFYVDETDLTPEQWALVQRSLS